MEITRQENSDTVSETFEARDLHSYRDNPAQVVTGADGVLKRKVWFNKGQVHREGGPAVLTYTAGQLVREDWYHANERHRVDGPATTTYNIDGEISKLIWCWNGKYHRTDGPGLQNLALGKILWVLDGMTVPSFEKLLQSSTYTDFMEYVENFYRVDLEKDALVRIRAALRKLSVHVFPNNDGLIEVLCALDLA